MNNPILWLKASLAALSVSVVCTAIAVFSYASNVPIVQPISLIEPTHNASQVAPLAVSHATKEITQQMILERSASCSEMISAKDKLRCLNKRIKMKKDFLAQEKSKCDTLEDEAGKSECFAGLEFLRKGLRSA